MPTIDLPEFTQFIIRLIINLVVLFIIVRLIYYPLTRRKDYLFTYFLVGIMVFFLCYLLESVKLQLGLALGLFAIFGIVRYRTDAVPIKEMTYLFIVIGLSVINALTGHGLSIAELIFTNLTVSLITFALERVWLLKNESNNSSGSGIWHSGGISRAIRGICVISAEITLVPADTK